MTTNEFPPQQEQPFLAHLIELRDRLLRVVVVVVVIFLGLFAFANDLYTLLAEPLLRHMPTGASMIATEVASPFLTPFKLTLVLSVFISIPFILYQAWGFIAPALYQNEKKLVYPLLISSTLLFYFGMAFAYFVVFPLVFGFLIGIAPEGVAVMTDITRYLDFVLKMFFAFGIAFEVPIATILLIWTGMTTAEKLAAKRPYIIVGAFVFGMLLTPPDVISQTLLALPMWILFELGLVFSKMYNKKGSEDDEEELSVASVAAAAAGSTAGSTAGSAAAGYANAEGTGTDPVSGTMDRSDAFVSDEELAENYSEDDDPYVQMTLEEMEAELDRLEREEEELEQEQGKDGQDEEEDEDEYDGLAHEEFEPMPEPETGVVDNAIPDQTDEISEAGEVNGTESVKPEETSDSVAQENKPKKDDDNPF